MRHARGGTIAGFVLAALIGVLAGLGAFAFRYAEGASYLSNDPKACINCHIMRDQFDGWQKAGHHAAATCNDCHTPVDFVGKYTTKMIHGYRHSKGFTLQDFHEPIRITAHSLEIVEANCVRCHETAVSEIVVSGADAAQGVGAGTMSCIHCHGSAGHGPRR